VNAWDDLEIGESAPPVALDVTMTTLMGIASTTWDYFPGHHDRDYARAQGQQDIYLSTMVLGGFLDRVALEVSGPEWFLRRRSMKMTASVFLGETLTGTATVTHKATDLDGARAVRFSIVAATERGPCVSADSLLVLPVREAGRGLATT
jgi:acyl dehydratase